MTKVDLANWQRAPNRLTRYPKAAGVYALFLNPGSTIPEVAPNAFGLLYVGLGQGARGLAARCHFKGGTERHSPRRSLAALLADELNLRPIFILKRSGGSTFKLDKASEAHLNQWMEQNLSVALQPFESPADYEKNLIRHWEPPLNCDRRICPLSQQQSLVLHRREAFKKRAEQLR